jgi:rhodanese-related sulfurtransferase
VFTGFLFKPESIDFKLKTNEVVKLMNDPQTQVSLSDLAGNQLIDVRPAEFYRMGHPENAINIPVRNLLDDESVKLFDQLQNSGQIALLCGSDELQATAPCLLLQQLGYRNVKILKGGFTANNELKEPMIISTETMTLDTAVMKAKATVLQEITSRKPQTVVPVRKEVSSGGGC